MTLAPSSSFLHPITSQSSSLKLVSHTSLTQIYFSPFLSPPYVKATSSSCLLTLLPNRRVYPTIFAPKGSQWVILSSDLSSHFLLELCITIAPRFKCVSFNVREHNFRHLAPDDPSSFIFTIPLAGRSKSSRAKPNLLPSLNVLGSLALENLLKLNF